MSASNTCCTFSVFFSSLRHSSFLKAIPPMNPWVKLIRIVTVDTKSISPYRGTKSIHQTHCSSYNLRVTQSCELPMPSSGRWTPSHHHRAQDECVDKEENSECVSRRWQLVAATFSAQLPPEHWWQWWWQKWWQWWWLWPFISNLITSKSSKICPALTGVAAPWTADDLVITWMIMMLMLMTIV